MANHVTAIRHNPTVHADNSLLLPIRWGEAPAEWKIAKTFDFTSMAAIANMEQQQLARLE